MIFPRHTILVFAIVCIIFLTFTNLYSQSAGTIRGIITDANSGEALPFANLFIEELSNGTSSDSEGHFLMRNIPGGRSYWLVVSYMGYESQRVAVFVIRDKITQADISLSGSTIELSEVEKTGTLVKHHQESRMSLTRITALELDKLPHGVEKDLIRSLKYVSGVQSFGDNSAKYYVRGSSSDQTQVLFNNAVIYYPFHAMNLVGVVDNNVVRSVEFQKGGFSAENGDRLGALLKINTRDGNSNDYSLTGEAGLLSAKLLLEGPYENGSFYVAGRKSYSNNILSKYMNGQNVPADYYDGSFKISYANDDFWQNARFTAYGFISNDNLDFNSTEMPSYKWSNTIVGLKYFQYAEEIPLYSEVELSLSNARGELISSGINLKNRLNEVRDMTFQANFKYIYESTDELSVGFRLKEVNTNLPIEAGENYGSALSSNGMGMCLFANWKLLRFENVGANIGVRANVTRIAGASNKYLPLEPRIDLSYYLGKGFKLKAAWGIYYQELITLVDDNAVSSAFDPWIILPTYFDPLKATHYISGIEFNPNPNVSVNVEGYYKTISNQPFINENRTKQIHYQILPGTSEAYGVECELNWIWDRLNIRSNYSLSWVYKERDLERYVPNYDSRHVLNNIVDYNLGEGWNVSLIWSFSSGRPYSQVLGYFDMLLFHSITDVESNLADSFEKNIIMGAKNTNRFPAYHRMDINLSKKLKIYSFDVDWDISVTNLYNRKNVFYLDYETLSTQYSLPFLITSNLRIKI